MKKTHYAIVAMLGLLITTAVVGITSFAATDNAIKPDWKAQHQEMRQIMIDGNYEAWSQSMQEKVTYLRQHADELEGSINQETFNKLQEAHQLMQDGDIEGAKTIFEELGIAGPGPRGMGKGIHKGLHQFQQTPQTAN